MADTITFDPRRQGHKLTRPRTPTLPWNTTVHDLSEERIIPTLVLDVHDAARARAASVAASGPHEVLPAPPMPPRRRSASATPRPDAWATPVSQQGHSASQPLSSAPVRRRAAPPPPPPPGRSSVELRDPARELSEVEEVGAWDLQASSRAVPVSSAPGVVGAGPSGPWRFAEPAVRRSSRMAQLPTMRLTRPSAVSALLGTLWRSPSWAMLAAVAVYVACILAYLLVSG